jgi:hypothetical protein
MQHALCEHRITWVDVDTKQLSVSFLTGLYKHVEHGIQDPIG